MSRLKQPAHQLGDRVHRWTILVLGVLNEKQEPMATCRCDCGVIRDVRVSCLKKDRSRSCGCLGHEMLGDRMRKHGASKTPERNSWESMIRRCDDIGHRSYPRYGGRGIVVCERWRGIDGFANFLADMGERPAGKTLDRFPDKDGNYEPTNCRWATVSEQGQNMRRTRLTEALVIEFRRRHANGEPMRAIARSVGLHRATIQAAILGRTWTNIPNPAPIDDGDAQ